MRVKTATLAVFALMLAGTFFAACKEIPSGPEAVSQVISSPANPSPSLPVSPPAAPVTAPVTAPQNPTDGYGIYESCDLHYTPEKCTSNLAKIANGGLKLVINYSQFPEGVTQTDLLNNLDAAAAVGLKMILAMEKPFWWDGTNLRLKFPKLTASCNCTDNKGFIRYIVQTIGSHRAVWGYYLGDETEPAEAPAWLPYAELIRASDPNRPRLMVHYVQQACCRPVLNPDLLAFADGLDVLAEDYYPIGRSDPPPPAEYVGVVAEQVQAAAQKRGKTGGVVLQSYALAQYEPACGTKPACQRLPSFEQMLAMRNAALLAAQPRFIFWYSFFDIMRSDDPARHWDDLVRAVKAPNPN